MRDRAGAAVEPFYGQDRELIRQAIEEIRDWLPEQGPIQVFIHHNTLHSFEDIPFEEAVEFASSIRNAEPYLTHRAFLRERAKGRISDGAVAECLARNIAISKSERGKFAEGKLNTYTVRDGLLNIVELDADDKTIDWLMQQDVGASELWRAVRERDLPVVEVSREYAKFSDDIEDTIIGLAAAYLDRGISHTTAPHRHSSFLECYRHLSPRKEIAEVVQGDGIEVIAQVLRRKEIARENWGKYLRHHALRLPGWAGTFSVLETRPRLNPEGGSRPALADYLAVRLLLDRSVADFGSVTKQRTLARQYTIYRLLKQWWFDAAAFTRISDADYLRLTQEIASFGDIARRRILHFAYERDFNRQFLGAVSHNAHLNRNVTGFTPRCQAVFCIDDREESLRRHLEETAPDVATYGIAGFFGVDMWYQGLGDTQPAALCPVVVVPRHRVREKVADSHSVVGQKKLERLLRLRTLGKFIYYHSRNLGLGWLGALTGLLASLPLLTRVLLPRHATRINQTLTNFVFPKLETELELERAPESVAEPFNGFTAEEMAQRVQTVLRAIGIVDRFAPLVLFLGHGSSSLNNPHESAYDCGACGGGRGGPNARAFARMANLPSVRALLAARGIAIPAGTHFVGGFHDTCSDSIFFYDLPQIPEFLVNEFQRAKSELDEARTRNAYERCRRFESARGLSPRQALFHVEGRSQDLREPRPEYGHSTNAICIVGRRELTRNLFLDRRAFLSSYDAVQDPEGRVLLGILSAVIPVCAGISLEYYFSFVDNERYGCGTKLAHNVTSLIGVMNGRSSDLRMGLTSQMVEIHEPMRILFVVECVRQTIENVMAQNTEIARLVKNRWVQLCLIHPQTSEIEMFSDGKFEALSNLPTELRRFRRSEDYFAGQDGALWPVRIDRGAT